MAEASPSETSLTNYPLILRHIQNISVINQAAKTSDNIKNRTLFKCQLLHHKSHLDCHRIKPESPPVRILMLRWGRSPSSAQDVWSCTSRAPYAFTMHTENLKCWLVKQRAAACNVGGGSVPIWQATCAPMLNVEWTGSEQPWQKALQYHVSAAACTVVNITTCCNAFFTCFKHSLQ